MADSTRLPKRLLDDWGDFKAHAAARDEAWATTGAGRLVLKAESSYRWALAFDSELEIDRAITYLFRAADELCTHPGFAHLWGVNGAMQEVVFQFLSRFRSDTATCMPHRFVERIWEGQQTTIRGWRDGKPTAFESPDFDELDRLQPHIEWAGAVMRGEKLQFTGRPTGSTVPHPEFPGEYKAALRQIWDKGETDAPSQERVAAELVRSKDTLMRRLREHGLSWPPPWPPEDLR